jgi:hypothetical protein
MAERREERTNTLVDAVENDAICDDQDVDPDTPIYLTDTNPRQFASTVREACSPEVRQTETLHLIPL